MAIVNSLLFLQFLSKLNMLMEGYQRPKWVPDLQISDSSLEKFLLFSLFSSFGCKCFVIFWLLIYLEERKCKRKEMRDPKKRAVVNKEGFRIWNLGNGVWRRVTVRLTTLVWINRTYALLYLFIFEKYYWPLEDNRLVSYWFAYFPAQQRRGWAATFWKYPK